MFSKSKTSPEGVSQVRPMPTKSAPAKDGAFSMIGSDVTISGNIQTEGDLHIDGRIEGDVKCSALVIGESGAVVGGIRAANARISGEVDGAIEAGALTLTSAARTKGDISYDQLSIEAGRENRWPLDTQGRRGRGEACRQARRRGQSETGRGQAAESGPGVKPSGRRKAAPPCRAC